MKQEKFMYIHLYLQQWICYFEVRTITKYNWGKASTTYKQNTKRTHKKQYSTHYDEDSFY
jgi:hypothetical protein